MPAPKKDPSVRARRNATSTRTVLKRPAGKPKVPALPKGPRWHPQVREMWAADWSSPMAAQWEDADKATMFMIARLAQQFWSSDVTPNECKALAGELRQLRAQLGLTPGGRKSLEWQIETPDQDAPTTSSTGTRRAPAKKAAARPADPRARFRVVNGG